MQSPVRLSHSTLQLLNTCERKFQQVKLLSGASREENEHLSFGHAFGAGVASYAADQDADRALYVAWLAYWPQLESDKKNQAECFALLQRAFHVLDTLLLDYDVVFYNDKVAAELSFKMEINESYYWVGHIDLVLKHRQTGIYTVLEAKTTSLNAIDLSPVYANSGQAVGYSAALDIVTGQNQDRFEVLYLVGRMKKNAFDAEVKILPFRKTIIDRLNWLISLGMDVERLERMKELNNYPRRGDACMSFNRPCQFFQTCHLSSLDVPKEPEPDEIDYQFTFKVDELVENYLQRVEAFRSINAIEEKEIWEQKKMKATALQAGSILELGDESGDDRPIDADLAAILDLKL